MRQILTALTVVAAGLAALPALAQPPDGPPGERGGRFRDPEFRQRMLDEFDEDGDGRLSDEERQTMRETMRERFGRGGPPGEGDRGGPPPAGERDRPPVATERRGPADRPPAEARRGREARSEGQRGPGRAGERRGRRLEALFEWFDANEDGLLDRQEFNDLARFVQSRRHGPPGERPGMGRRGPDGPPPAEGYGRRGVEGRRGPEGRPAREGFGRRGPGEGGPRGRGAGPPPRGEPADPRESEGPPVEEPI